MQIICKICHHRKAVTTDCRCESCIMKPEVFIVGNETLKVFDTGVESSKISKEDKRNFYKKVFKTKLI